MPRTCISLRSTQCTCWLSCRLKKRGGVCYRYLAWTSTPHHGFRSPQVGMLLASSTSNCEWNWRAALRLYAMALTSKQECCWQPIDQFSKQEARNKEDAKERIQKLLVDHIERSKKQTVNIKMWVMIVQSDTDYHVIEIRWLSGVEVNDNRFSNRFLAFNLKYLLWHQRHLLWGQSKCCRFASI